MVIIPGYQIKKLICKDKTYAMYRAVREKNEQPVILKRLHVEDPPPNLVNQFQHEYALLQSLKGEGIAGALDLITIQDQMILIYEDIGGLFLDDLFEKKPFSIADGLAIAIKITAALERVHHAGFIHKRINPFNILYHVESETNSIDQP